MIHSLAGGTLGKVQYATFVKVQLSDGAFAGGICWFVACGNESIGDDVIVPFGKNNQQIRGKVLRIDKNVSSQVSPVPFSRAKQVIKVIKSGE